MNCCIITATHFRSLPGFTKHGPKHLSIGLHHSVVTNTILDRNSKVHEAINGDCVGSLCNKGRLKEAVDILYHIDHYGMHLDSSTYGVLLQGCAKDKALAEGRRVHAHLFITGFEQTIFIGNHLVNFYAKCGSVIDARQVFDKMPARNVFSWNTMIAGYFKCNSIEDAIQLFDEMTERNVVSWTTMIAAHAKRGSIQDARKLFDKMPERNYVSWTAMIATYAQHGEGKQALYLFCQMQRETMKLDQFTFASVLSACASLEALDLGKQVHTHIIKFGLESNVFVGSALVDMYSKCRGVDDARQVFDKMSVRDVHVWTAMISGYARCGNMEYARQLFDKIHERNVVTWNAMISSYTQHGHGEQALKLFSVMQNAGLKQDHCTFPCVLSACANLAALAQGRQFHAYIIESGFELDVVVGSALVDMYAKSGSIEGAHVVFDKMFYRNVVSWNAIITGYAQNGHVDEASKFFHKMPERNVVSWNAMIAGYAQNGHGSEALKLLYQMQLAGMKPNVVSWTAVIAGCAQNGHSEEALRLFQQMQVARVKPNSVSTASVLPACANLAALEQGSQVHGHIVKTGLGLDVTVGNALIDTYVKCGSVISAYKLFNGMPERDRISWNAMIAGCAQYGHCEEAVVIFRQMQWAHQEPDQFTFGSFLRASANLAAPNQGVEVHNQIIKTGFESDVIVGSALVDMYSKCKMLEDARCLFDNMPEQNVVSWTAMISGYAQNGFGEDALKLACQMLQTCIHPEEYTYTSMLVACSSIAALQEGKMVHAHTIKSGLQSSISVQNALIDMYGRCSSTVNAHHVFHTMSKRDTVSWNAIIGVHAQNDDGKQALKLLCQMRRAGLKPDQFTFPSVLRVSSSQSALEQGKTIHGSIIKTGYVSSIWVGSSLVDMYSKCGNMEAAWNVFEEMPGQNAVSCSAMIAGYA